MNRCISIKELKVHYKRWDGGNDINNAQVLCHACYINTNSYGKEIKSPPEFSNEIKEAAKKRAGYRCECEKEDCHINEDDITKAVKNASELCKRFK